MKKNEKTWEDNWDESSLIQVGAKVPGDFAKIFTAYCGQNRFVNQRELFYNLAKWWYLQDPITQEHICRDRIQEALSQISMEPSVDYVPLPKFMAEKKARKSAEKRAIEAEQALVNSDLLTKHRPVSLRQALRNMVDKIKSNQSFDGTIIEVGPLEKVALDELLRISLGPEPKQIKKAR